MSEVPKKAKKSKGRVIRVSDAVYAALVRKKQPSRMSWDSLLRKMLGMPDRRGREQKLYEGYFVPGLGKVFEELPKARGEAVKYAVLRGSKKPPKPIPVREIV